MLKHSSIQRRISTPSTNASKWRRCHQRRRRRMKEAMAMELVNYLARIVQLNCGCKLKIIMVTRFKITRLPMYLIQRLKREFWSFLERLRLQCGIGSDEQEHEWKKRREKKWIYIKNKLTIRIPDRTGSKSPVTQLGPLVHRRVQEEGDLFGSEPKLEVCSGRNPN